MTDTQSQPDIERAAFIKAYPSLDMTEVTDAWGRPMFKHPHIQSMWNGWIARAARCSTDNAGDVKQP